jgi:nitroreductase
MPQEKLEFYLDLYANHLKKTLSSDENIYAWTAKQTAIAAANMMTAAAVIGVDSCPMEGYDKGAVERLLGIDPKEFQLSMLVAFGYRADVQSQQLRLDIDEVVEWIE